MPKIIKKVQNFFIYDSLILETSSGTVYLGIDSNTNEEKFIEVVTKLRFPQGNSDAITQFAFEMNFLKETFCHYWLKFVDFIETTNTFYVVFEAPPDKKSIKDMVMLDKKPIIKTEKEFFKIFLQFLKAYIPFCARNQPNLNISSKTFFAYNDPKTKTNIYKLSPCFQYDYLESLKGDLLDYSYLPPEIIQKISVSSKTDLWSLGVVLYEMIFMVNPFESKKKENVLKRIETQLLNKNDLFSNKNKFSDEFISFFFTILEPNLEKRINWKDLFKHKFVMAQGSLLKQSLVHQIKEIHEAYSKKSNNISPEILESVRQLKENFALAARKNDIYQKIENIGEFELIGALRDYRLLEECKEFYCMKMFDDQIKIEQLPEVFKENLKNLSPRKRKSLFVNLDNRLLKDASSETSLIKKKQKSSFPKFELIPSFSIKTYEQALKTMIAKYMYQKEMIKQFRILFDCVKLFSKEFETVFLEYCIAKYAFFRFLYFKDRIIKNQNIFDLPFWEELKKTEEYLNLVRNPGDLFAKDHSESYFALQTYRESGKAEIITNPSETFYMQFSISLNQQVFMETDFVLGFKNFALKFLQKFSIVADNEFIRNKKNSRKYYELALRIIGLVNFASEFGLTKFDKDAKWDFEELGAMIDSLSIDNLKEETTIKLKVLL